MPLCSFQKLPVYRGLGFIPAPPKPATSGPVLFIWPSLWSSLLPPSSIRKGPCDYIRPTWIIQDTLPLQIRLISKLNSPLPRYLTLSRDLGLRTWTSWGGGNILLVTSHNAGIEIIFYHYFRWPFFSIPINSKFFHLLVYIPALFFTIDVT